KLSRLIWSGRRGRRQDRIASQPESRYLTGHTGGELRNEEILGWKRGCRGKHHASRIGTGVDRHVLVDGERNRGVCGRTGTEVRRGSDAARGSRMLVRTHDGTL